MSWMKKATTLAVLAAVAACSDSSPSRSLAPTGPSLSKSGNDNNASRPQVTGFAAARMPEYGNAPMAYDIVAIGRPNGSVDGQLNLVVAFPDNPAVVHADPFCVTIAGDTARLAALVTRSNTADLPPGSYVIWSIVDNHPNGERQAGGRKPDESTIFAKVLTALDASQHCNVGVNIGQFHPVQGNLTVHQHDA